MIISGQVAAGFEPVKTLYEHNMRTLAEKDTQLCIYVGDQCVVDLWASTTEDPEFSADSLINVFSSGKSLEAITMAMLVDRGHLDYDAKIADYWPEFCGGGGSTTTIADLMRHEAGLAAFDTTLEPASLEPGALLENAVGEVIERQTQKFRPGVEQQREYHAVTRGWIANEVFRRVEPAGRTMGQFLREELSTPLDADVYIGLSDEEIARIAPVVPLGVWLQVVQGLRPRRFGRSVELNLAQTIAKLWRLMRGMKNRTTKGAPVPIAGMQKLSVVNSPEVARGEIPSAGAKCSARGLAKLAAVMANGGSLGGNTFLSEAAHASLHDQPVRRNMMSMNTTFTQGGLAQFASPTEADNKLESGLNVGREGFYGWMGLGGSIFQWHPQKKIGFAYVPTSLNVLDIVNERGKAYQAEVLKCVS